MGQASWLKSSRKGVGVYTPTVGDREHQAYNMLKDRIFLHTPVYDDTLLSDIGMDSESSPYGKPPGGTTFTP